MIHLPFKPPPAWRTWATSAVCLSFGLLLACTEEFSAAPGGAGGTAGGSSTAGAAGVAAGSAGTNAGASGTGDGGAAGNGGGAGSNSGCSCADGQYCRAGRCYDCADTSSLEFATPERIFATADENLRFPRQGEQPRSLFFRRGADSAARLWYSEDHTSSAPVALDPMTMLPESGLVYLGVDGVRGFNVLFDLTGAEGRRMARSGRFDADLSGVSQVVAPLAPSNFDLYEIAVDVENERIFSMSTESGAPELRTGKLGGDATTLVELTLPAGDGATCARPRSDATPWVTRDGRLLLFRAPAVDGDCEPIAAEGTDLYGVPLDATLGSPLGTAVALDSVNQPTADQSDPSFSVDLCTLYFAAKPIESAEYGLYRSARR